MTPDAIAFWANVVTLVAAPLGLVGLGVAIWTLWAARRAASAAAVIPLNEAFRQAWLHFVKASDDDEKQYAFADILNLLELACAIYQDKLLVAKGGKLLEDYVLHALKLIERNNSLRPTIEQLMVTPLTFKHIADFLQQHRSEFATLQFPPEGSV